MITLNLLCPESLFSAANHLAAAKGQHIADLLTFRRVTHTRDGVGYCAASGQVSESWLSGMSTPATRPAYDTGMEIDLPAAQATLDALTVVTDATTPESLPDAPTGLVVGIGIDLAAYYGLQAVNDD